MKEITTLNSSMTEEGSKKNCERKHIPEIGLEDIVGAAERLKPVLEETRLIWSSVFSEGSGNEVYLKPENLQRTGSFKIRGAYNAISLLSEEAREKGVITTSSGNHAQGVAFAAREAGVSATIVMPETTPLVKRQATEEYGCKVILYGNCYDEAYKETLRIKEKEGKIFIHPFNDLDVIAGQGTIGLEILNELPETDVILVPIGGGGLIAGIALAAKAIKPEIKIIGVEPAGAAAMHQSIQEGHLVELDFVNTIADGIAVKKPGDITFKVVNNLVDRIITVPDHEIIKTLLVLLAKHKLLCEPSGAVSLASLFSLELNEKGKKIVAVISGGNVNLATLSGMIRSRY